MGNSVFAENKYILDMVVFCSHSLTTAYLGGQSFNMMSGSMTF